MKEFIVRVIDPEEIQWYEEEPETPELIRCKDCKWNSGYGRGMYVCFCTCYKTGTPHKDDWYCAYAERRDGDGE